VPNNKEPTNPEPTPGGAEYAWDGVYVGLNGPALMRAWLEMWTHEEMPTPAWRWPGAWRFIPFESYKVVDVPPHLERGTGRWRVGVQMWAFGEILFTNLLERDCWWKAWQTSGCKLHLAGCECPCRTLEGGCQRKPHSASCHILRTAVNTPLRAKDDPECDFPDHETTVGQHKWGK